MPEKGIMKSKILQSIIHSGYCAAIVTAWFMVVGTVAGCAAITMVRDRNVDVLVAFGSALAFVLLPFILAGVELMVRHTFASVRNTVLWLFRQRSQRQLEAAEHRLAVARTLFEAEKLLLEAARLEQARGELLAQSIHEKTRVIEDTLDRVDEAVSKEAGNRERALIA